MNLPLYGWVLLGCGLLTYFAIVYYFLFKWLKNYKLPDTKTYNPMAIVEYKTPYHWNLKGVSKTMQDKVLEIAWDYIWEYANKGSILDVGCGDGYMTNALFPICDVTGIDVSPSGLEFARKLSHSGVTYLEADARSLPFPDNHFDAITSFEVIEHIPMRDLCHVLLEMKRALKPGGKVILTTPNRQRLLDTRSKKHYQEFSGRELKDMMEYFGFKFIELKGIFFYIPVLGIFPPTRKLLMWLGLKFPLFSIRLLYVGQKK